MTRARSACWLTEAPHEGPMNVPLTSDSATPNALARSVRTFWLSVSESRSVCTRTVLLPTRVTLTPRSSSLAPTALRAICS